MEGDAFPVLADVMKTAPSSDVTHTLDVPTATMLRMGVLCMRRVSSSFMSPCLKISTVPSLLPTQRFWSMTVSVDIPMLAGVIPTPLGVMSSKN